MCQKEDLEKLMQKWKNKQPTETTYIDKDEKNKDIHIPIKIDHKNNLFINDGIINYDYWNKASKKILFVFKEAYDSTKKRNNSNFLIDDLNNYPPWKMWLKVCDWANGILNTNTNALKQHENLSSDQLKEIIKQISFLNLKKSNGKSSSNSNEISEYAKSDSTEIKKEIEIINPDVIICGHTFDDISKSYILDIAKNNDESVDNFNNKFFIKEINNKNVIIIDFYHPACHYPNVLLYYGLISIYQQALSKIDQG